ncbi:hypothetical protein OEZ86_007818 [Tetradesmus obliquus]|nr:hypothetical protein OEZ86_007818 [Tetradesmus obliquus]
MASAAVVDCRPLRDTGTTAAAGSGALASLRTAAPHDAACGGGAPQSPLSNGANSGQRTPGSARGKGMQPAYALQLYAIEAVGRKCSVMQSRSGVKAWEKAQILEYNHESGQHKLRYNSSKAEEWLCLGDIKFKWSQLLPPTAPANPSYRPEFAREGVALSFAGTSSKAKLNRTGSRGGAAGAGRGGGRHAAAAAAAGAGAAGTQLLRPGAAKHAALCNGTADGSAAAAGLAAGAGRAGSIILGKHARDSTGGTAGSGQQHGESFSKRMRRLAPPRSGAAAAAAAAAAGNAARGLVMSADKHLAVGCRVAVYWRLDRVYYKGKLTSFSPQSGRFTIRYDDGGSEALLLERERFAWHSPRAASAGYRPALHSLMQQLGAEGIAALPQTGEDGRAVPETAGPEGAPHPPISGPGAVGWRLLLYWPADQAWHEAEVLSHDEARRQHHLLFLDGEEEWADLSREHVVWLRATRPGALSAGIVTGDDVPKGRDAVGWRMAVYWKDDRTFYEGTLADYEPSSARHKVQYVDGEQEWLALRNERVIWRLPPKDDSSSDDDGGSSDDEAGGLLLAGHSDGEGGMRRSRKRRVSEMTDVCSKIAALLYGSGSGEWV